jgi:hypothetical protein
LSTTRPAGDGTGSLGEVIAAGPDAQALTTAPKTCAWISLILYAAIVLCGVMNVAARRSPASMPPADDAPPS